MLPKKYRLRKKIEFQSVYNKGHSLAGKHLVMYCLHRPELKENLIAFAAGKKIGKAHVRNLIKRRMREAFRKQMFNIEGKYYIILIARAKALTISSAELEKSMRNLLDRGGLLKQE